MPEKIVGLSKEKIMKILSENENTLEAVADAIVENNAEIKRQNDEFLKGILKSTGNAKYFR